MLRRAETGEKIERHAYGKHLPVGRVKADKVPPREGGEVAVLLRGHICAVAAQQREDIQAHPAEMAEKGGEGIAENGEKRHVAHTVQPVGKGEGVVAYHQADGYALHYFRVAPCEFHVPHLHHTPAALFAPRLENMRAMSLYIRRISFALP